MGVENNFSAHLGSSELGGGVSASPFVENSLLGYEREQKLNLLLHLIVNLQSTLILRGVAGVGKTRMLTAAASRNIRFGDIFLFKATGAVSFESIQNELRKFVEKSCGGDCPTLESVLEYYAQRSKYLVLMIDDAVVLVPGLIRSLLELSVQCQALRLVFSFTPEEYLSKGQAENLDNQCHFIELPELNLQQCKLFLQQAIDLEKTVYVQEDIDTAFVNNIYMATKGVPGSIIQLIAKPQKKPLSNISLLVVLSMLVVISSVVISAYFWQAPEIIRKKSIRAEDIPLIELATDLAVPERELNKVLTTPNVPNIAYQKDMLMDAEKDLEKNSLAMIDKEVQRLEIKSRQSVLDELSSENSVQTTHIKEQKKLIEQASQGLLVSTKIIASSGVDDRSWVLGQNSHQYTLQLMALSDKKKLLVEKEKYYKLGYQTFFIERKSKKANNYVLLYGRYPSIKAAKNAMQKLPKELRNSWPRRFNALQKSL